MTKSLTEQIEKLERRLYDKDQGFVPVLNIVLRNIEREQSQRKLTDLELSIKSQVKGVLGYNGLVDSQKAEKKVVNSKTENRVYKLERQLAEANEVIKFFSNSKIGTENNDGTYQVYNFGELKNGTNVFGWKNIVYDPRPAKKYLKKWGVK